MPQHRNPFIELDNPYAENPFRLLGINRNATRTMIYGYAHNREQQLKSNALPVELRAIGLNEGAFFTAARSLENPVVRLAFDLMEPEPSASGVTQ